MPRVHAAWFAVCVLCSVLAWMLAAPPQQAHSVPAPHVARWEYKYVAIPLPLEAQMGQTTEANKVLRKLGEEGWEYAGWSHVFPASQFHAPYAYVAVRRPDR